MGHEHQYEVLEESEDGTNGSQVSLRPISVRANELQESMEYYEEIIEESEEESEPHP